MKDSFPGFYFSKLRIFKLFFLFFIQKIFYALQFSGNNRFGQQAPFMTSGNILQTTILFCRVVQPTPTRKMGYRFCSCPVRIILVPCHHASQFRRLPEDLVVPETNRNISEQLTCSNEEAWIP